MNTALGSDNISPYFLKNGGDTIHKSLFLLFSICFRHGMVPTSFRHGHVVTLYKGEGEVSDPNNYRPITITSVLLACMNECMSSHCLLPCCVLTSPPPSNLA